MRTIRRAAPNLRGQARMARHLGRTLSLLGPVSVEAYGCRFVVDLRDHVEEQIFWERYEQASLDLWRSGIDSQAVVLDVGANVGLYSLVAALNGAHVIAFEPNPPTRDRLLRNLALNPVGARVSVDPRALTDVEGSATLFDDVNADQRSRNFGVASLSNANAGGRGKTVETTTIDAVAKQHSLSRLDWIKMDIQGAELAALKGARTTLRELRPVVLLELDPENASNMGWTPSDLEAFLASVGYSLSPFDGLNVIARPIDDHARNRA